MCTLLCYRIPPHLQPQGQVLGVKHKIVSWAVALLQRGKGFSFIILSRRYFCATIDLAILLSAYCPPFGLH